MILHWITKKNIITKKIRYGHNIENITFKHGKPSYITISKGELKYYLKTHSEEENKEYFNKHISTLVNKLDQIYMQINTPDNFIL